MVLFLGFLESMFKRGVLGVVMHFLIFWVVLALVDESSSVSNIPRVLFVFILALERSLLSRSLESNLLEVNREGILVSLEHSWTGKVILRNQIFLLLLGLPLLLPSRLLLVGLTRLLTALILRLGHELFLSYRFLLSNRLLLSLRLLLHGLSRCIDSPFRGFF